MGWNPELDPEGETQERMSVDVDLPVDGIPQVQPQLLALVVLVLQAEIVGLVGYAQVLAHL